MKQDENNSYHLSRPIEKSVDETIFNLNRKQFYKSICLYFAYLYCSFNQFFCDAETLSWQYVHSALVM